MRLLHLYLNFTIETIKEYSAISKKINYKYFEDYHHVLFDGIRNNDIENKYKDYYVVAIYRNTYDRVCSMYYNNFLGIISDNLEVNKHKIKRRVRVCKKLNTFKDFLNNLGWPHQNQGLFNDFHFIPQEHKGVSNEAINKKLNITNLEELFLDYDINLNDKMKTLLNEKNLNHKNNIKKYTDDSLSDISSYNFFLDEENMIKDNTLPDYKYLLNNKEVIEKINDLYRLDFIYFPIERLSLS